MESSFLMNIVTLDQHVSFIFIFLLFLHLYEDAHLGIESKYTKNLSQFWRMRDYHWTTFSEIIYISIQEISKSLYLMC